MIILAVLLLWFRGYMLTPRAEGHQVAGELWEFATAERRTVQLQLDGAWPLAVGDPIYRIDGSENVEHVGEIRQVEWRNAPEERSATGPVATALLYPGAPKVDKQSHLTYYSTPQSLTWVIETMLPAENRARIAREILSTYELCHAEVLDAMKPVVVSGFANAMKVVEEDLAASLRRHRPELEHVASQYQDQVVEQELIPLVREEIWPIVQRRTEPLADNIGQEIFERASLWRFGWRIMYDKSFLPRKQLTQQEWKRFMQQEAIPVLSRHQNDILTVQHEILKDVSENEKVRSVLRKNLADVIEDPEFRAIVWQVFQEAVIENPRLHDQLLQHWKTPETQHAVEVAAECVEPCVRRIGDLLFGTRDDGIAPEFAQVLRNQILNKDCRWLVINTNSSSTRQKGDGLETPLQVRFGGHPRVNPFAVRLQGLK